VHGFVGGETFLIRGGVAAPWGDFKTGHLPARRGKFSFRQLIRDLHNVACLRSKFLLLLKHRLQKLFCSSFHKCHTRQTCMLHKCHNRHTCMLHKWHARRAPLWGTCLGRWPCAR
jgi:hypothetical protein